MGAGIACAVLLLSVFSVWSAIVVSIDKLLAFKGDRASESDYSDVCIDCGSVRGFSVFWRKLISTQGL